MYHPTRGGVRGGRDRMDKASQSSHDSRQSILKLSFKQAINGLLTSFTKEEVSKAFGRFTNSEQEALHRLFVQVISSLHANILEDLVNICVETKATNVFEIVEQLVEQQSVDPLFSDKTNIGDVWQDMSTLKKNETEHLMNVLQTMRSRNES